MLVRTRSFVAACAAGALVLCAGAEAASAQRSRIACGLSYLPLAEGNEWTYEPVPLPEGVPPPLEGLPQGNIKVRVAKVATKDGKTEITLEETYRNVTRTTTSTCTAAGGLIMSPESFFFAGEPGGAVGMTLSNVQYKGPSYPGSKGFGPTGTQWYEELRADVAREPAPGSNVKHPPAKVEVERLLEVAGSQVVDTGVGQYVALKVTFELRGRGIVGDYKAEIPAKKDPGALYFYPNLGMVWLKDLAGQEWKLVDTNLTLHR